MACETVQQIQTSSTLEVSIERCRKRVRAHLQSAERLRVEMHTLPKIHKALEQLTAQARNVYTSPMNTWSLCIRQIGNALGHLDRVEQRLATTDEHGRMARRPVIFEELDDDP